jgi:hypothetical protein
MVLAVGTHLGPCEILSAAGDMAEVYHPRDAKLDRHVAIILPERVHDSCRRTRLWSPELASRTTCSLLEGRTALRAGDHRRRAGAAVRGATA